MTHGLYHLVPVAEIIENPSNPRRAMDKAALAELTDSVRAHGVLQPLLARRTPDGERLELVAGHRRLRAAVNAGLDQVPVIERVFTDKEVLEIQVIENLQRSDLHPLEEAEGYRRLHQEFGYSTEDLIQLIDELQLSRSHKVMTPDPERLRKYRLAIARNDGTIVDLVLNDLTYGDVKEHREIIERLLQCVVDAAAERIRERSGGSAG